MQITKHFVFLLLVSVWLTACTDAVPEVACLKECNTAMTYEYAQNDGSLNFKGFFLSNSDVKLYEDDVEIPVQPTFVEGKLKVVPVSNSPHELKAASVYKLLVTNAVANGTSTFTLESANISTMSGDVSGTPSATSVDKIKGVAVTTTALTSGNVLKYNGTAWVNSALGTSDISGLSTSLSSLTTSLSSKIDQSQMPASCSVGSTLVFSSPTGSFTCSNIAITDSQITYSTSRTANTFLAAPSGSAGAPSFRALTLADMPSGISSQWTTSGSNIHYSTGNVGIGTSSPSVALDVNGQIKISGGSPSAGKVLTSDGVGLASWQTPAATTELDPKVGSNTTNYLSKWNGSALVTSGVYEAGGLVGIGTSSPVAKFDVRESNSSNAAMNVRNDANGAVSLIVTSAGGTSVALKATAGGSGSTAGYFDAGAGAGPAAVFVNGNVGIGTASPTKLLTVVGGDARINNVTVGRGGLLETASTALGVSALAAVTGSGIQNTAVGYQTLMFNTDGLANTAVGANSMRTNTTGSQNTALGISSMNANTSGNYNVAVGSTALQANTTGSYNTAVGLGSLIQNTTGGNNVGVGYQTLQSATGSNNVAIGSQAGSGLLTQNNTVIIGNNTGSGLASGTILLADGLGTERLRIDNAGKLQTSGDAIIAGKVGIANATPSVALDVVGEGKFTGVVTASNFVFPSDARYKRNLAPIDNSLSRISEINGFTYSLRTDQFPEKHFNDRRQIGVIAQEIEKQFPELVFTDDKGYKSVNYAGLVAPIIEAIKELMAIKADKSEIEELRAENAELKMRLERLEKALDKR